MKNDMTGIFSHLMCEFTAHLCIEECKNYSGQQLLNKWVNFQIILASNNGICKEKFDLV